MFRSKVILQTAITLFGSLVASACAAVALIVITRQLGPEKYGEFSVGFALLLILVRVSDMGMTNVVLKYASQEKDETDKNRIFSFTTRVRLVAFLVLSLTGLIVGHSLAQYLKLPDPRIIYLAFFLSACTSFYEHLQSMLQSLHRFSAATLSNILQALTKTIIAGIFYVNQSTAVLPIFIGYMTAPLLPLIFSSYLLPPWTRLNSNAGLNHLDLKRVKAMAFHSGVGFVAAGLIENIDVIFVQRFMTTYDAGILGGVSRIALLFSILAYALGSVLNPRVARYKEQADILTYMKKSFLISLISVGGYAVFVFFSKNILLLTIGSAYLPGLEVMNILVASSFLTIAAVPFIALFFTFETPWYFSASGVLQVLIIVIGNVYFVPQNGVEAAAWVRLAGRVALYLFTVATVWYAFRTHYTKKAY